MRYETAVAFRQALEQRLLARARERDGSLVRLRKTVAFERLLARLVIAARGRWVLKGALALDFRMGKRARTTKDMDLLRRDDEEAATVDLIAVQTVDLGDFFTLAISGREVLQEEEGAAVRFRVRAELAGRLFEEVLVDVGFSDPLGWQPEPLQGSDLLAFADIEPIEVPALSLEQQVAENVHAYTRTYGGHPSNRAKDLIDLVLVKQFMTLDAGRLRTALVGTFEGRRLHPLPSSFPRPPADWTVPYRKSAQEVGISPDLATGHAAAALLDPVLAGLEKGRWEPEHGWV